MAGALVPQVVSPAAATPPPAAEAPTLLFHEDFENGLADGQLVLLADYEGAGGESYDSDPNWNNPASCNGFVLDGTTSDATINAEGCTTGYAQLRSMATALGTLNGTGTPSTNHAVAAFTANPASPNDAVEFRTAAPLPIPVQDRFLTFSVNTAVVNCFSNHPQLHFFLDDGTDELPVTQTPIDPCPDGARSISSDGSVLFSGSELGIVMRNAFGGAGGNDHAFDDIRVFDATPQLSKDFADDDEVLVGDAMTLTFTATNTTELAAKEGWSFTDTLPGGMAVADPANVGGTCAGATSTTAVPGSGTISVVGDLATGEASCTVTVDVVASAAGSFTNGAGNIDSVGIDLAEDETVVVAPLPPGPCPEDGLQVGQPPHMPPGSKPPLVSGTVHQTVEPLVTQVVDPLAALLGLQVQPLVHQINCEIVEPVEDVVDDITIPIVTEVKPILRNLVRGLLR